MITKLFKIYDFNHIVAVSQNLIWDNLRINNLEFMLLLNLKHRKIHCYFAFWRERYMQESIFGYMKVATFTCNNHLPFIQGRFRLQYSYHSHIIYCRQNGSLNGGYRTKSYLTSSWCHFPVLVGNVLLNKLNNFTFFLISKYKYINILLN